MDHDSPAIKKIDITQKSTTIADLGKTPKKLKKMAEADEWTPHFLLENQSVDEMVELLDGSLNNPCYNFLHKLVSIKQQGYKSQDRQKNLFDKNKFISVDGIFDLLKTSMLICFYCSLPVKLVYSHARDPKQWSLERVDNSYGHNTDNVVIACLDCNLRRRTMFQERYKKTKEMYHVVKLDH